jgi:hypothetical protein
MSRPIICLSHYTRKKILILLFTKKNIKFLKENFVISYLKVRLPPHNASIEPCLKIMVLQAPSIHYFTKYARQDLGKYFKIGLKK